MLFKKYFLLIILSFPFAALAQNETAKNNADTATFVDVIDILNHIFKKKNKTEASQKRAERKFQTSLLPGVGYTLQSGFVANISANSIFKTSNTTATNLSSIIGGISATSKQQLLFNLQGNIWLKASKYVVMGDVRLYKYPQDTYGLGGFTTDANATNVTYNFFRFYASILKHINNKLFVGVGLMADKHWNISKGVTTATDFDTYGFSTESISSGLCLNLLSDGRSNPINATKGYFFSAYIRQNTKLLNSNTNWASAVVDYRKYIALDMHETTLALWNYDWITLNGKPPYLDLPSTAWDSYNNVGRGYIQSRFRSENLLYLESELRFNITRNKLLGAVLFANAQSFTEFDSKKFERVIPGYGAGLRIKFNKHSRTNLCVDYGFGINGSGGIFVNLGEVF